MNQVDYSKAKLLAHETRFVAIFMRFEFALKAAGFCNKEAKYTKVDWAELDKALGEEFFFCEKTQTVAKLLISEPPKKQIITGGNLDWKDWENRPRKTSDLITAVCGVRNNLLHGGKHSDEDDSERNKILINEALEVIELMLCRLDHGVRAHFEDKF